MNKGFAFADTQMKGDLIEALARAGIGPRRTARMLMISPGLVMYHRDLRGIAREPPRNIVDEIAALPEDLQERVRGFRGMAGLVPRRAADGR